MQAINQIDTHTKFGKGRINTFLEMTGNQRPDTGWWTAEKTKIICPPPVGWTYIMMDSINDYGLAN